MWCPDAKNKLVPLSVNAEIFICPCGDTAAKGLQGKAIGTISRHVVKAPFRQNRGEDLGINKRVCAQLFHSSV